MAYNKAKEEYKWKLWKEQEEKRMREFGVSEEIIAELREYDWNCFKEERTYLQTATFCGQQGRISRTVRAILNGQPGISAGQRVLRPTDQY